METLDQQGRSETVGQAMANRHMGQTESATGDWTLAALPNAMQGHATASARREAAFTRFPNRMEMFKNLRRNL